MKDWKTWEGTLGPQTRGTGRNGRPKTNLSRASNLPPRPFLVLQSPELGSRGTEVLTVPDRHKKPTKSVGEGPSKNGRRTHRDPRGVL